MDKKLLLGFVIPKVWNEILEEESEFIPYVSDPFLFSSLSLKRYVDYFRHMWRDVGKDLADAIVEITDLPWRQSKLECSIVGGGISLPNPLVIPIPKLEREKRNEYMFNDLIHQLIIRKTLDGDGGNPLSCEHAWIKMARTYSPLFGKVYQEIILFALHEAVMDSLEMSCSLSFPEYVSINTIRPPYTLPMINIGDIPAQEIAREFRESIQKL
jgi:hypothetical protein